MGAAGAESDSRREVRSWTRMSRTSVPGSRAARMSDRMARADFRVEVGVVAAHWR